MPTVALERLDDPAALESLDPSGMLRVVAGSAAQIRTSLRSVQEASLEQLGLESRPRAIVVAGMGGSGISGEVLAALTAAKSPVPVVVHRGYGLPGWVGAADLVMAVSCSGTTAETLSSAVEAARRGARLLGVGAAGSPLDLHCRSEHGAYVPVTGQLAPRASLWALITPLVVVAQQAGLLDLGADLGDLEAAATRLEAIASACRPDLESFVNPAKSLAAELLGTLPMFWGCGDVGPVSATRAACQVMENAKSAAMAGALPEAHHNQSVALDGRLAGAVAEEDIFRDRVADPDPFRLRLVLLRDDDGGMASARADASAEVARARGVGVSVVTAEGASRFERLASIVGLVDFASVYLGLASGFDPTPIGPIDDLKARLAND
ncbi:MAG TPA: SIS domain-containing protein [Mycobacteriales bacterium]|jgi:glucose/mannose-6-phosphate isomerase|nr:SIS domain-containing protein [Mycobacteriales bacterium]HVX69932.1 SIS domain-containing protein [Mycobacteriales bacterium]